MKFRLFILLILISFMFSCTVFINKSKSKIQIQQGSDIIEKMGLYDFGSFNLGATSNEIEFTIRNVGKTDLILLGMPEFIEISGADKNQFQLTQSSVSSPIKPDESSFFTIKFKPDSIGEKIAMITIISNDKNNGIFTFDIKGTCVASPDMNIKQEDKDIPIGGSYDFGGLRINSVSKFVEFKIENKGNYALHLTGSPLIKIIGADDVFTLLQITPTSFVIPPGNFTSFTIAFTPFKLGVVSATISIENNDPDENPYTFTVTGEGIADIYVNDSIGSDFTGDGSESNPYKSIQKGIDEASVGDTVIVEDGTYKGEKNRSLDFKGKDIHLYSRNGYEKCFIDCQGSSTNPRRAFIFHSNETNSAILSGFTIQNGYNRNDYTTFDDGGGAIYISNSSPTIQNCKIVNNKSVDGIESIGFGAGLYLFRSKAKIYNCIFTNNNANGWGGGIFFSDYCEVDLFRCAFNENSAETGGGIEAPSNCEITLNHCTFELNYATVYGGGISSGTVMKVNNCLVINNRVNYWGGGIATHSTANVSIANCTISGNSANMAGGGVICYNGTTKFIDTIIWNNNSTFGREMVVSNQAKIVSIKYCNINNSGTSIYDTFNIINGGSGFQPGINGNIAQDPRFVTGSKGDYYLEHSGVGSGLKNSPCINAGSADASAVYFLQYLTTRVDNFDDTGILDLGFHYSK